MKGKPVAICRNTRCKPNRLCANCRAKYPDLAAFNNSTRGGRNNSGWTPRVVGTVDSTDEVVTFREGVGDNDGHTLIADGDKSATEFNSKHNHYGQKREGGGRVDQDRGHYTGPGH